MPPRPTRPMVVALVLLITVILILLVRPFSASLKRYSQSSYYRDVFRPGHPLRAWLADEEARYAVTVQERLELITKWGPSEDDIVPFPKYPEFGLLYYTLWDFFIPAFQCPHRVQRVGMLGDGGKWVCGLDRVAKQDKCVIYSFGVNNDSSFESTVLQRAPSCEVWGYDYSVGSWGPQIANDPELMKRAHFTPFALGGTNNHTDSDYPKYWTLDSLMDLNGHTFIDILKIDIEGDEFDALTTFLAAIPEGEVLPVGQLQIEIHAVKGHEDFKYFSRWWAALEAAGLRPFWAEPNLVHVSHLRGSPPAMVEYSFINIRGDHALVNEAFN